VFAGTGDEVMGELLATVRISGTTSNDIDLQCIRSGGKRGVVTLGICQIHGQHARGSVGIPKIIDAGLNNKMPGNDHGAEFAQQETVGLSKVRGIRVDRRPVGGSAGRLVEQAAPMRRFIGHFDFGHVERTRIGVRKPLKEPGRYAAETVNTTDRKTDIGVLIHEPDGIVVFYYSCVIDDRCDAAGAAIGL